MCCLIYTCDPCTFQSKGKHLVWNGYVPARRIIWIQNMDEVAIHTPKLEVLKYCTHLAGLLHVCFQGGGRHSCQGLKHDSNQPVSAWFRVRCYIILTLRSNRLIVTCVTTGINHQSVDYCITPNSQPLYLLTIPSLIQSWRDKSMFWLYIYIPFSNKSCFLEHVGLLSLFNKPPPITPSPNPIWPNLWPYGPVGAPCSGRRTGTFRFVRGLRLGILGWRQVVWFLGSSPHILVVFCWWFRNSFEKNCETEVTMCIYKYTGDKASKLTKLS